MHLAVVTDAWHPQINGVVQTWSYMRRELESLGHRVTLVTPEDAASVAVPGEPELRLVVRPRRHVERQLGVASSAPIDALHIATEGPLGWAARRWAARRRWPFTTSYHTRFPEYLARRYGVPAKWSYAVLRRFHAPARAVLVATQHMVHELQTQGFQRLRLWPRGVDHDRFSPQPRDTLELPRPIFMYVGRVAPEKNLEALLELALPGSTVIVGDGPAAPGLRARFPRAVWLGAHPHAKLATLYSAADVFVFPSRTDTFGLVMLEAMACGTPVAAFPVTGPLDVVEPGRTGMLDEDLRAACLAALQLDRAEVRQAAQERHWRASAEILLNALARRNGI
ncbi:MAG TPA: glycosyltransferase family 1 protein [Burkholderiaceae bacterium]|nr:glycosyltransferase family 1 protein [Burkholderiaceae bacterium]